MAFLQPLRDMPGIATKMTCPDALFVIGSHTMNKCPCCGPLSAMSVTVLCARVREDCDVLYGEDTCVRYALFRQSYGAVGCELKVNSTYVMRCL